MRRWVAVHDVVAFLHEVAFLHRDVFAFWHHVFDLHVRIIAGFNRDAALVLIVLAKAHVAIDFILWTAGFEQFGHTWQTTCNILCLGAFARDTRNNVTSCNLLAIFDGQNRIYRHRVGHRALRQSVTIFWVIPVASSVSSRMAIPLIRSTNLTVPAFSAMIGRVYGSHSNILSPRVIFAPSLTKTLDP